MDDFLQMHIFFFVTTIAVVAVAILAGLVLWRIFRILGYVEKVTEDISAESSLVRADMADLRARIRVEGFKLSALMSVARASMARMMGKKKRKEKE